MLVVPFWLIVSGAYMIHPGFARVTAGVCLYVCILLVLQANK